MREGKSLILRSSRVRVVSAVSAVWTVTFHKGRGNSKTEHYRKVLPNVGITPRLKQSFVDPRGFPVAVHAVRPQSTPFQGLGFRD